MPETVHSDFLYPRLFNGGIHYITNFLRYPKISISKHKERIVKTI